MSPLRTFALPTTVLNGPHWRVNVRPQTYKPDTISSISECFETIEATKVRLRGWDYPHLSRKPENLHRDDTWVASWSLMPTHLDYWRFYQSGQFLHYFAVSEYYETEWQATLRRKATFAAGNDPRLPRLGTLLSIENLLYRMTEIFEFVTRLCQRGVYSTDVDISVRINGIKNSAIVPGPNRSWHSLRMCTTDSIGHTWTHSVDDLVSSSAQISLRATDYFLERFDYAGGTELFATEQGKLLKGLL